MEQHLSDLVTASCFVAAVGHNVGYSIYDNGKMVRESTTTTKQDVSYMDGIWLGMMSAVRWCRENIPDRDISFYAEEKEVADCINSYWDGSRSCKGLSKIVRNIIIDCCNIGKTSFGAFQGCRQIEELKTKLK